MLETFEALSLKSEVSLGRACLRGITVELKYVFEGVGLVRLS
jgi:hypothetical protein